MTTRGRVIQVALEVFAEKGVHGATVVEIAKRAGVTGGALYRYFESKEDIFRAVVEQHSGAFAALDMVRGLMPELEPKTALKFLCQGIAKNFWIVSIYSNNNSTLEISADRMFRKCFDNIGSNIRKRAHFQRDPMLYEIVEQRIIFFCSRSMADPFCLQALNRSPNTLCSCCLAGMCISMKTHPACIFI